MSAKRRPNRPPPRTTDVDAASAGAPALSLREIRLRYLEGDCAFPATLERALRVDTRPGARAIVEALSRRRRANRAEGQRLRHLTRYERERGATGITLIAGIDEVGMSPLAGPVTAAAVILPLGFRVNGIDDSKRLDAARREAISHEIQRHAIACALGWVDEGTIDRLNIYHAGLLAMRRAVEGLAVRPEELFVDARVVPGIALPQLTLIRGDQRSISIAAASIVAKVGRDAHMTTLDRRYPGYGFARHKGYPVRAHREALRRLGPSPVHRRSFRAVREAERTCDDDGR